MSFRCIVWDLIAILKDPDAPMPLVWTRVRCTEDSPSRLTVTPGARGPLVGVHISMVGRDLRSLGYWVKLAWRRVFSQALEGLDLDVLAGIYLTINVKQSNYEGVAVSRASVGL